MNKSTFTLVLTCLQLLFLIALSFLLDPKCRGGHPGLVPVWRLSGPAALGRRRRRGSRLSRVPETEWPVSSMVRAWRGVLARLFESSRGRRCQIRYRGHGLGREEGRTGRARVRAGCFLTTHLSCSFFLTLPSCLPNPLFLPGVSPRLPVLPGLPGAPGLPVLPGLPGSPGLLRGGEGDRSPREEEGSGRGGGEG